jgi:hypothetical protein
MKTGNDRLAINRFRTRAISGITLFCLVWLITAFAGYYCWKHYVSATPLFPYMTKSEHCSRPSAGFYKSATDHISFAINEDLCFSSSASETEINRWYKNQGYEFGGRVGWYWDYHGYHENKILNYFFWRRVSASENLNHRVEIVINIQINIGLFPK